MTAAPLLRWPLAAVHVGAVAFLSAAACLIVWAVLPMLFGWTPTIITSNSMAPVVYRGDVVLASPPAPDWRPAVGQVVIVPDQNRPGSTRTHRIAGFDDRGRLVTRGDAVGADDSFRTAPDEVVGIGRLLIPRIGLAPQLMREGHPAMFAQQTAAVLLLLVVAVRLPGGPETPARPGEPRHTRTTHRAP
jgi:signal peptidase I